PRREWWNNLRDVEKVFYGILFTNACVYLAWKVPAFRNTLQMYFTDHTLKTPLYLPMLLNAFSHYSVIHLGINMYVLSSFSTGLSTTLKGEEFLAFYMSAAVFSSFTSLCLKVLRGSKNASVGASGAIFAIFALFATTYPNANLQIVLIPNFTFTAEKGLIGAMCLDFVGMLFNWKIFDHASHFGGALFGLWYAKWGRNFLRNNRIKLAQKWHDLRSKK
ncbi:presenilins-associated rhomboid-like protein: mitochondrial isoform X1, partial [Leptotrombidium deliense]